jgi:hypothetical protein
MVSRAALLILTVATALGSTGCCCLGGSGWGGNRCNPCGPCQSGTCPTYYPPQGGYYQQGAGLDSANMNGTMLSSTQGFTAPSSAAVPVSYPSPAHAMRAGAYSQTALLPTQALPTY